MGDDFTIIKMLLPGVYHYHFIVDEQLRFDPDLPWGRNELGSAYNILELKVITVQKEGPCLSLLLTLSFLVESIP